MDTKRTLAGITATMLAAGALATGMLASAPDRVYHDLGVYHDLIDSPLGAEAAAESGTTSRVNPGVYHDL